LDSKKGEHQMPDPYKEIYVAIDNSELSDGAMELAVVIGKEHDAHLYGSHVYAAKLHERRFKMMEGGLPEEYQEETSLDEQRVIHDSLISDGLALITDSYLGNMATTCQEQDIPFSGISLEGKNWQELVRSINRNGYDLVALGGHGIGRVSTSLLGSVTERVLRRVHKDILICKRKPSTVLSDEIVVCLDGSAHSFGALERGIQLARAFDKRLVAVSAFDPYFHYTMFNSLKDALNEKARDVFKFEEQEELHEKIIDAGLAKVYQANLDIARRIVADQDIEIETHLLDGKAFDQILDFVASRQPWMTVMGRIGIHSDEDMDIGSNTENICRIADCNILVVEHRMTPPVEYQAEETVTWTREAEDRMTMVPAMARGVAVKAIQNYCVAEGHTVVTTSILYAAIRKLLPPDAIAKMGIQFDDEDSVTEPQPDAGFRCRTCNYVHHGNEPAACPVCSGNSEGFEQIARDPEASDSARGKLMDREISWQDDALKKLEQIRCPVMRNQVRAKAEKRTLTQRHRTVTVAMLTDIMALEDDTPAPAPDELVWTDAAMARLERVPNGFMRSAAQGTIEDYARNHGLHEITVEVAEAGMGKAREKMAAAFQGSTGHPPINSGGQPQPSADTSWQCGMCGYVVDGNQPAACDSCDGEASFTAMSEEERRAASISATMILEWSDDALDWLEQVPCGFMRDMSRRRIEQWARDHGRTRVMRETMQEKYASWAEGSSHIESKIPWSAEARARAEKIPDFIRPMVMGEIENIAVSRGKDEVDGADIDAIVEKWGQTGDFHDHHG
jgi:nucleotide-binding universal stress UspA family protein/rubrerythrin